MIPVSNDGVPTGLLVACLQLAKHRPQLQVIPCCDMAAVPSELHALIQPDALD